MVRKINKSKKRKWGFLVVAFFLLFLLIFGGLRFFRSLGQSLWDGRSQFNLVVNSRPVMIASFDYQEKTVNVLAIPEGTFVETIHGYGPYRVESIYKLGEMKGIGGELLAGSLQQSFGLNIDGYMNGGNFSLKEMSLKNFLLNQFFSQLHSGKKTNLTRWDQFRLWWFLKKIHENKMTLIDLSQTSASQEVDLPDGSRAMKIDQERLGRIISQFFVDRIIKEKDLSIGVWNKTEHFGLANKAALIIGNIGGRVVQISNQKQDSQDKGCQIKSNKKDRSSYAVVKLSRIFDCRWEENSSSSERVDIILIIGEDYWEKLNLP